MVWSAIPIPTVLQNALGASLPFLITIFASIMQTTDYIIGGLAQLQFIPNVGVPAGNEYDYIVVGGGSAGAVIASRLTENATTRLLLIEAGGDPNPITYVPGFAPAQNHPDIDWLYETVRLNNCALGMQNHNSAWNRGKALGGTSNQNYMIYNRGNPNDFDNWAKITGDSRWSYSNVARVFRKLENYHGNWPVNEGHSVGGPLHIQPLDFAPGHKLIVDAAKEFGYITKDPNNFQSESLAPIDVTQMRGSRFGTFVAYIKPNLNRPNLIIHRYSQVTKIHFDANKKAVGVEYIRHGQKQFAFAKNEIILSTGAIGSPHLLMLSGVGPRQHLLEHGIQPVLDLPGVGSNLQEHVSAIIGPYLLTSPASYIPERDFTVGDVFNYIFMGTGPLATPLGMSTVGLISTQGYSPSWPNIMFTVLAAGISPTVLGALDSFWKVEVSLLDQYLKPHLNKDTHFVLSTLGLPKSRGEIRLKDSSPFTKPLIDPKYYTDPGNEDIKMMVDSLDIITRMYENTTALGGHLGARLPTTPVPGCEQFPIRSRAYYECVARTFTVTLYHPSSTCAMGRVGDPNAVVDSQLRVIGVTGLRVADASIMPQITNANLNAPSIMIGEMCSEIIKETWTKGNTNYGGYV